MVLLMQVAVIGGLLIKCLIVGYLVLIQELRSFGRCQVQVFVMSQICMVCLIPKLFLIEPSHFVFGSFNHTRKITRTTQQRFGAVLSANPDAVLQFRNHSFQDPSVRRYFLQRFRDAGIAPHQLQPLPYAPSSAEAMSDYGRIHLHLDSYPVSGTTTTLDSLAMGIPVLTCPTPYYSGAISAAILEHAGLAEHICPDQASFQVMLAGWQGVIAPLVLGGHWLGRYANHRSATIRRCHVCLSSNFSRCCVRH